MVVVGKSYHYYSLVSCTAKLVVSNIIYSKTYAFYDIVWMLIDEFQELLNVCITAIVQCLVVYVNYYLVLVIIFFLLSNVNQH